MNYSVLMSVYFKEKPEFLRRAIQTTLDQEIQTNDFVVVCDGELTEALDNILNQFKNKYPDIFHIYGYKENKGLGFALNYGLKKTINDIVMRMDSDDVCMKNRASIQLPLMEQYDLVGGSITEFENEEDNLIGLKEMPLDFEAILKFAKKRCPFNHPTVMFNKKLIQRVGGYKTMLFMEDFYLWIRVLQNTNKVYNVKDVLVNMRSGIQMRTRRSGKLYKQSLKELRNYMLQTHFINYFGYFKLTFIHFVFTHIPIKLKEFVYKKFLRKKYGKK